jgi:anaphase-promoting complex subunit 3
VTTTIPGCSFDPVVSSTKFVALDALHFEVFCPKDTSESAMTTEWRNELRAAVHRHLATGSTLVLESAIFLCEQLTQTSRTPEPADLLLHATCLEKNGDSRAALAVLEKLSLSFFNTSEDARFMKATCLFKLGMFVEAKNVLLQDERGERSRTRAEVVNEARERRSNLTVPKGALGYHLLGLIASQHAELEEEAAAYFDCAAALDPFLFQARERAAVYTGRRDPKAVVRNASTEVSNTAGLLTCMENACYLLASHRCDEVLATLATLPIEHQKTGFVLSRIGRAHFEKAEYPAACESFERMRVVDPNRVEGLEFFSTALWHLSREVDLAYLAKDVAERAPKKPQTWCVVGNCFSLEKEHDTAIRFFKRALQLDDTFTYAYTLAGHEYIANDDVEEAMACYRHALRTDRSHYIAWWGLGTIYARQEKHDLAELHFRKAIAIHPGSSVLWCFLGSILVKSSRFEEALDALDASIKLQANNPQARFQRAKVMLALNHWDDALEELEYVRDLVPREASVHMFLGKVYSQLKQRDKALVHYVAALDLDPKGATEVREAVNQLDDSVIEPPAQRAFDIEED